MNIDRYTKAIMTVIAVALFMIALNPWIAPTKAYAELTGGDYQMLSNRLNSIASAINGIKCR